MRKFAADLMKIIEESIRGRRLTLIGTRDVAGRQFLAFQSPGNRRLRTCPCAGISSAGAEKFEDQDAFERKVYLVRKVISSRVHAETEGRDNGFYPVSMSSRTIVYKGMFLAYQVGKYYLDLTR